MSTGETRPDIEIIFALGDGPPTTIGAGTYEDAARAFEEGEELDRATKHFGPGDQMSPGATHFYKSMGEAGGVSAATEEALRDYALLISGSREALLARIRQVGDDTQD